MNLILAVGWTLVHFLWQAAFLTGMLAAALALLRNRSARVRYAISCGAMLLMLVCALATFVEVRASDNSTRPATAMSPNPTSAVPTPANSVRPARSPMVISDYLPAFVWTWFAGVIVLSLRSLGGWSWAQRFSGSHTWAPEGIWEQRFSALAKRLAVSAPVRLAISGFAQVPAVVGWLRPVVLLPATVFTALSVEQIEALLAHELAHVRRYDYLVNLLQIAAETLFFYHPGVWWVSRQMRKERENCCDDLAIEICGSTLVYVRALTELEQMRIRTPRLAMAADGGSLLKRVERLLGCNPAAGASPSGWVAALAILGCLVAVSVATRASAARPAEGPRPLTTAALPSRPAAVSILIAQQTPAPAPPSSAAPARPQTPPETKKSGDWLDGVRAEGYTDLSVDQLIALKIHGVDGDYIRAVQAAVGTKLTSEHLVAFRIHEVTADWINELKQAGLRDLTPDKLVALKIHGADGAWHRGIQALGYPDLSPELAVTLRIHQITPAFIREAQSKFKNLTLEQVIRLKLMGILKSPEII
jgi:beta-lactamase regulating signal transducer with metallopeptidase domain